MDSEASATPAGLLERDRELATLDRLIDEAEDGQGRVALIEGPAGIGKSRLLAEVRERADRRMTVLHARCSELERDFSFGAVRQLLEALARDSDHREALLAGAAASAAGVLDSPSEDGATEGSFAVLHGLYWATLNLAEQRPVLLSIDDLQWSDRPSLRFVAYLAHRLEGAPVLVATTLRSTDPGADSALLAEIAGDPLCEAVRPGPLGGEAIDRVIADRLDGPVDRVFRDACEEATGGNPLLLRQLLNALADDGVDATAGSAAAVREIGPRAVSRTVLPRLGRLSDEAVAVAQAVAVLGESSELPAIAALTGLDETTVGHAAGDLARAEILRPEPPLGFAHPLLRDAVYRNLPPGERELQHARAADVLAQAHASVEEVAAQLVQAPRRGDPAAVDALRAAGSRALRRGAPESAVTYLARALDEPPAPGVRGDLLLELGAAEAGMNAPAAVQHLREAYDELSDPAARAAAAFNLAQSLLFTGGAAEGGRLAQEAAQELPPELGDERQALEAVELISVFFGGLDPAALDPVEDRRAQIDGDGLGARQLSAAAAFALATSGRPAGEYEDLALQAFTGRTLLDSGSGLFWSAALAALILAESGRTVELLDTAREEAYRHGSVFATSSAEMWLGLYLLGNDLEGAGESLRAAFRLQDPWGSDPTGSSWARGFLAYHALTRGDAAAASEALGPAPSPEDESDGANFWRRAHAELLLAGGKDEEALAVAEAIGRAAPHVRHPDWKPWNSLRGRILARLGRHGDAREAFDAELALADRCGSRSARGRCLRLLGELDGDEGIETLREAVDVLAGSPARLEQARALASLGGALRRARRPSDARDPLRQALELAEACDCPPLVEQARSELHATGARPRTTALAGVESLTARELRVATLAAEGSTNREIAQALYVTPKTVEVHLSNAYRKLGIRSRRELPGALAAA